MNKPRSLFEAVAIEFLALVKSPKSVASPVEAIVIYSIVFTLVGVDPPAKIPLVEERPVPDEVAVVKFPKSVASPVDAIAVE